MPNTTKKKPQGSQTFFLDNTPSYYMQKIIMIVREKGVESVLSFLEEYLNMNLVLIPHIERGYILVIHKYDKPIYTCYLKY